MISNEASPENPQGSSYRDEVVFAPLPCGSDQDVATGKKIHEDRSFIPGQSKLVDYPSNLRTTSITSTR
jgi:hypothetical protein